MHDKHICRKCLCYLCGRNDKCLRCQYCIDNNMFLDKDYPFEYTLLCEEFEDEEAGDD